MGLLANIDRGWYADSMLVLASDIAPFVASLISLMILAGIHPRRFRCCGLFVQFPDGTQV